MSTVPSILPAFANKRDLIICDEVRPALQRMLSHDQIMSHNWTPYSFCHGQRRCLSTAAISRRAAAQLPWLSVVHLGGAALLPVAHSQGISCC